MLCSHNPPKAVGDSRFWKCNLGCLMASPKAEVAAIASLGLLWAECHLYTVYMSSSLWLVLLHSSCSQFREVAHQPVLAVPQDSEEHSTVGAALEMLKKCPVWAENLLERAHYISVWALPCGWECWIFSAQERNQAFVTLSSWLKLYVTLVFWCCLFKGTVINIIKNC